MILVMVLVCFPRLVQGEFAGKVEESRQPPIYCSEEQIQIKLEEFMQNPYQNKDITLTEFLKSLTCTLQTWDIDQSYKH